MNKKIIAALVALTIVFMCAFVGCNKLGSGSFFGEEEETGVYVENKDIDFVTDENGEKVLDADGRIIVYATDEDGKKIKDNKGEYVTQAQEFQPIADDGVIEDLGFILKLPKGWDITNDFGRFVNEDEGQTLEVSILNEAYSDYYTSTKQEYEEFAKLLGEENVTWGEGIKMDGDFRGLCRFTLKHENSIIVMYFFENSKNLYKVRLVDEDSADTAIDDSIEILESFTFKPYVYYRDVTTKPVTSTEVTSTTGTEQ